MMEQSLSHQYRSVHFVLCDSEFLKLDHVQVPRRTDSRLPMPRLPSQLGGTVVLTSLIGEWYLLAACDDSKLL